MLNLIEDILLELVEALRKISENFTTLYPIQYAVWKQTIGPGRFERDLCINSPTGSGKTLSYALPIVQFLSTRKVKRLRALVVLPSRDLALQTCDVKSRPLYLAALLQELEGEHSIVFANSKDSTHELCTMLNCFDLPFKIREYSALQRQSVRNKTLKQFRAGKIQVLIASDAMTCGMDVEGVRNAVNYTMPSHVRTYIHRAGRTARAGNTGCCFTFLARNQVIEFKKLLKEADKDSCSVHYVPDDIVEKLSTDYDSAKLKYKECMQLEKRKKKRKMKFQSSRASERSMEINQENK